MSQFTTKHFSGFLKACEQSLKNMLLFGESEFEDAFDVYYFLRK